jgi:sulfatase modifying factor 1
VTLQLPLVDIPAGVVTLQDARTATRREVQLQSFRLGRTAVTQAQYAAVTTVASAKDHDVPVHGMTWRAAVLWCNVASANASLAPAYEVTDAAVSWLVDSDGYRLPTEAEWEWACRAGTTEPTYGPLSEIAWTAADDVEGPQPVELKRGNAFGAFDMIGNVWEWCWDYADTARYADYRSLRGGGWADPKWSCRASVRRGSSPDAVLEDVGFRVARGAVGEAGWAAAQGWSAAADLDRADRRGPLPVGWTPLR